MQPANWPPDPMSKITQIRNSAQLLRVAHLNVELDYLKHRLHILKDISFELAPAQTHALVGESGAGKTMTMLAILGLLPSAARICKGNIFFRGNPLTKNGEHSFAKLRGRLISVIFQNAGSALNPLIRVGQQIADVMRTHLKRTPAQIRTEIPALFEKVGLHQPEWTYRAYPHQLSGGMAQRVMIALALSCHPELIIADEPTTALDVALKKQILELIRDLQTERGFALLLISHDLSAVATLANTISIMRHGQIIESGDCQRIFENPRTGYTQQLLESSLA